MKPDPRDRVIDLAIAIAGRREVHAALSKKMRALDCVRRGELGTPCWANDDEVRSGRPLDGYCGPCQESGSLARQRFVIRRQIAAELQKLWRAARGLRGSHLSTRFIPGPQPRA